MPCGLDHGPGSWSFEWWQVLEQVAQALRQVKPRSSEVAEERCLMPPGHSLREDGLAQGPKMSLVFRECPGKREERRGLNPGRLPGEADFGVSSRVPGLDCICFLWPKTPAKGRVEIGIQLILCPPRCSPLVGLQV